MYPIHLTLTIEQADSPRFVSYIEQFPNLIRLEGEDWQLVRQELKIQLAYILWESTDKESVQIATRLILRPNPKYWGAPYR